MNTPADSAAPVRIARRSYSVPEFAARNDLSLRDTERKIAAGLIKIFQIGRLRRIAQEEEDRIVEFGIPPLEEPKKDDMSRARAAAAAKRQQRKQAKKAVAT